MTKRLPPSELKIGYWLHVIKLPDAGAGKLGGCWLWQKPQPSGYGSCSFRGRTMSAHRAAWIQAHGEIPNGIMVLHKCDVRNCVRPSHLFLGTGKDNMTDMWAKGRGPDGDRNGSRTKPERRAFGDRNGSRTHPEKRPRGDAHWLHRNPERFRGEKNPHARLTDADVASIRQMRLKGYTQDAIAQEFGVAQAHVSRLVRGVVR